MPSPVGLSSRSSSRARSVPDRSPGSGNAAQLPSQCVTGMSTSRVSPFRLTLTYLQRLGASEGGGEGVVVTESVGHTTSHNSHRLHSQRESRERERDGLARGWTVGHGFIGSQWAGVHHQQRRAGRRQYSVPRK